MSSLELKEKLFLLQLRDIADTTVYVTDKLCVLGPYLSNEMVSSLRLQDFKDPEIV